VPLGYLKPPLFLLFLLKRGKGKSTTFYMQEHSILFILYFPPEDLPTPKLFTSRTLTRKGFKYHLVQDHDSSVKT